jgi:hypothetical protein
MMQPLQNPPLSNITVLTCYSFVNCRPEYVGILLGLSKIGVTAALINTNLTYRSRHLEFFFGTDKEIRRYGGMGG